MTRLRVLHLIGLDDTNQVTVTHLSPDPSRFRYDCVGNVELRALLDDDRFDVVTHIVGKVPSDGLRLDRLDVVVNAICDPDTNSVSLGLAAAMVDRLGGGVGVVNDPSAVLATTRDRVASTLAGVPGAVIPRTARIEPAGVADVLDRATAAGVAPPFLVREAGTHGGHQLVLVGGEGGAGGLGELEQFAFDGRAFYVTEFVDFASPDGLYRKYRALVIDGEPMAKHLIVSDHWNVHSRSRAFMATRPDLQAEDEAFVTALPGAVAAALRVVHQRLPLDYLGADFGIDADGRVVVFEVNCCFRPLVGVATESSVASHQESTARLKAAFADLVARRAGGTAFGSSQAAP